MPNWCYQHLKVQGTKAQLKQFKKEMLAQSIKEDKGKRPKKGETPFTFGLFKEFPPILNACDMLCGTNGHSNQQPTGENRKVILDECGDSVLKKTPGKDKEHWDIDPKELTAYLNKTYEGHTGWHDWNCSNWGTKWNACSVELKEESAEELHYYYETAWSPALPALEYATAKYPDLTFRVTYTEESDACAGLVVLKGGEVVSQREFDPSLNTNGYLQTKYMYPIFALASLDAGQLAQVEGTVEQFEWEDDYFDCDIFNAVLRAVLADELHYGTETFEQELIKLLALKFDDPEAIEVLSAEDILKSEEELTKLIAGAKPEVIKEIQELFLKNAKEYKNGEEEAK
jgi:hypothetical protein